MKIPPKINWKKRFWRVFSEYIRKRDHGQCFTCSTKRAWNDRMDAGHFIPAGRSNPAIYFHEKNVHCQCKSCNKWKHGNLSVYAERLIIKYGRNILTELGEENRQRIQWNAWMYSEKIKMYKQKIKLLEDKGK